MRMWRTMALALEVKVGVALQEMLASTLKEPGCYAQLLKPGRDKWNRVVGPRKNWCKPSPTPEAIHCHPSATLACKNCFRFPVSRLNHKACCHSDSGVRFSET